MTAPDRGKPSLEIEQSISLALLKALAEQHKPCALTLADAKKLADLAERKAREIGIHIVFSVVDAAGTLVLFHRMDGALPASVDVSVSKAYTSAMFHMPTHELGQAAQPGQPLYGIQSSHQGRVILFGGGYPCRINGSIVGAIGVSGGSGEEDICIATYALQTFLAETGRCPDGGKHNE